MKKRTLKTKYPVFLSLTYFSNHEINLVYLLNKN